MLRSLFSRLWVMVLLIVSACTLNTGGEVSQTFNGAPLVTLVSPAPNNTYLEGVNVNIQATVSNAGPDIARVEIKIDDTVVQTLQAPNSAGTAVFSVTHSWTAAGEGTHNASVTAFRADGSGSEPATVLFNVVVQRAEETEEPEAQTDGSTTGSGQNIAQPTLTPTTEPTTETPPTEPPAATPTPSVPTLTIIEGANVRRGPSTLFQPPIGSLSAGTSVEIIGVNSAGDWYQIRYYQGEGWVFASLGTVSGDTSGLEVVQGPPLPTAVPTVIVQPTSPPSSVAGGSCGAAPTGTGSNFCVSAVTINNGGQPFCGTPTTVVVTVGNNGNQATGTGFFVTVTVTRSDNSTVFQDTQPTSNIIQPGGTTSVTLGGNIFTHMNGSGQTYRVTITFNPNGNADLNPTDSTFSTTYVLGGTC